MSSFNKITIVGYLGRDPDLRYSPQGTAIGKLSVATTERRKDQSGETIDHTTWFRVTLWGRQAELAHQYLAKGRQVYIEGRFRLEEYTDREGNVRVSPEVNATDIQFLGQHVENSEQAGEKTGRETRPEEGVVEERPAKGNGKRSGSKRSSTKEAVSIEDDGIPF
jgi:single-strand DNA-binding protein